MRLELLPAEAAAVEEEDHQTRAEAEEVVGEEEAW